MSEKRQLADLPAPVGSRNSENARSRIAPGSLEILAVNAVLAGSRLFVQRRGDYRGEALLTAVAIWKALPGRCECYIPGDIQDQRDAAGVFQPMILQETGSRFLRRAAERNVRLPDLEVYVFQRKMHGIDGA